MVDLSTVTQRRQVEAASFNKFVGKHLDEKTARELSLQLRELRITKNLSTLAYEMGEDDTLLILQRGFRRSNGQIAMGFTSDAGFSNTLVSSKAGFVPTPSSMPRSSVHHALTLPSPSWGPGA